MTEAHHQRNRFRRPRVRPIAWFTLGSAFLLTLAFIVIFTESVPFYYEDVPWIVRSSQTAYAEILTRIIGPAAVSPHSEQVHRPVEELILKAVEDCAGFRVGPYRYVKDGALVLMVSALVLWMRAMSGSTVFPALAGLWLVTACPTYQSTLWICDFEVIAHVLIIACLLSWHRGLSRQSTSAVAWLRLILLMNILAYTAMKTKESAAILPVALLLSGLALGRRTLFAGVCAAAPMLVWLILPGVLQSGDHAGHPVRWSNVAGFANQIPLLTGGAALLACCCASVLLLFRPGLLRRTMTTSNSEAECSSRAGVAVVTAWTLSAAALWPTLPSSETRYLVGFLVPAITSVGLVFGLLSQCAGGPRVAALVRAPLVVLMAIAIGHNLSLDVHFRGFRGRQFVAIERTMAYVEATYRGAVVFYRY